METPTAADLEERAAIGFEEYRRMTYRSYLFAALGLISPPRSGWRSRTRGPRSACPCSSSSPPPSSCTCGCTRGSSGAACTAARRAATWC
ncbi:hypothetical protein ACFQHO_37160 [Actinomadura yumaensis]|uniref:hypothetical protein n=1 Tax=Actinomadura yumaensis TaxID=111807 RepID=UPI003620B0F3